MKSENTSLSLFFLWRAFLLLCHGRVGMDTGDFACSPLVPMFFGKIESLLRVDAVDVQHDGVLVFRLAFPICPQCLTFQCVANTVLCNDYIRS